MITMKKYLFIALSITLFACGNPNEVTETFHVYGNCMMCEETIENSMKETPGLFLGDWDRKTKQMKVVYDTTLIDLQTIKEKIAGVGYDMEDIRAEDVVYDNLHKCCKYKRPE